MIAIKVKVFASLRDLCGFSEKELHFEDSISVEEFLNYILEQFPVLISRSDSLLVAVNEEYCSRDYSLKDGDIVAIFPPVSGG